MKVLRLVGFVFMTVLFVGCNPLAEKEKEYDALLKQVIDGHDMVMPKMGDINSLMIAIKVEEKKGTIANNEKFTLATEKLAKAYKAMMDWMKDFGDNFDLSIDERAANEEELLKKIALLKEEVLKVEVLKEQINSSILNANTVLGK